jgi:hypothetical protein
VDSRALWVLAVLFVAALVATVVLLLRLALRPDGGFGAALLRRRGASRR